MNVAIVGLGLIGGSMAKHSLGNDFATFKSSMI